MPNTTYATAISVTTLDDFSSDIWDLTIGRIKLLRFFKKLGFVNKQSGGANIVKRLEYAENNTFGSISEYEAVTLTPQEPFTAAVYAWKILAGSVSIGNLSIFKNSGSEHQISNLLKDLIRNAAHTASNELNRQLWADGTGNGGKDFGGIRHLVAAGSWGTVGGIDSNSDTWWRNQVEATVGSFAANGIDKMGELRVSCGRDNTSPGLVVGDYDFLVGYEKACLQMKRIVQSNKMAHDLGLPNLEYAGLPAIEDPNQTAGYIDMLTPDTLELVIGTDLDFKKSPMVSPVDQDVKTQMMVLYGNLVTKDRSTQGLAYGVTYP